MQVGIKTPAVSFIPESLTSAVTQVPGITNVSSEVYALVMLNNNPLNLHGITSNFQNFTHTTILNGKGLDALQHPSEQIIIAGQTIAKLLNLTVGQSYTLFSVTTGSFSSFTLAGIVKFNSIYDDEVFSTIIWTQFFRPEQNKNDISLLRIRYNPQVISTNALNTLLESDYTVNFHLFNQSLVNTPAKNIEVSVYTAEGVFLFHNFTDNLGNTSFHLLLGVYNFIINNGSTIINFNRTILSNTEISLAVGSTNQHNTFSMEIKVFENNSLITGANITILSVNGTRFILESSNDSVLTGLSANSYFLSAIYDNYNTSTSIYLNKSLAIYLNLTFPVVVNAINASKSSINNFSCSFTNLNNKTQKYSYLDCTPVLYLPQGDYNVSITSAGYKNIVLGYNLSYTNLTHIITAVLGNFTTVLTFVNSSNTPLALLSVYYMQINNQSFIYAGQTDAQGQITIHLNPYLQYLIKFNNSGTGLASTFPLSSLFNFNKTIVLEENFLFQVTSYLVTKSGIIPINNTQITITTQANSSYSSLTNSSGQIIEELNVDKILNITAIYKNITKKLILSTVYTKNISFYFGPITFLINTKSTTTIPLPQTDISIFSGNTSLDFQTDQYGKFLGALPTFNTSFQDYTGLYSSNQLPANYVLDITFRSSSIRFILPQTYFGNYYTFTATFSYFVNTQLYLRDSNGNPLTNAIIILENSSMNYNYSALTNNNGIINNFNLSVGYYNVNIEYNGLYFNQLVKIASADPIYLTIPIVVTNIAFTIPNQNYLGFSGQQVTNQFLGQSTSFFLEIILIVIISTTCILIMLLMSLVNLIIQDNSQEIRLLAIVGASYQQIIVNLLVQFQKLSILGSIIGLALGAVMIITIPAFQEVQIVGLIIKPQFSLEITFIYFCLMNILVFIFLSVLLASQKWKTIILNDN